MSIPLSEDVTRFHMPREDKVGFELTKALLEIFQGRFNYSRSIRRGGVFADRKFASHHHGCSGSHVGLPGERRQQF